MYLANTILAGLMLWMMSPQLRLNVDLQSYMYLMFQVCRQDLIYILPIPNINEARLRRK